MFGSVGSQWLRPAWSAGWFRCVDDHGLGGLVQLDTLLLGERDQLGECLLG
jgi:hypothetical protein